MTTEERCNEVDSCKAVYRAIKLPDDYSVTGLTKVCLSVFPCPDCPRTFASTKEGVLLTKVGLLLPCVRPQRMCASWSTHSAHTLTLAQDFIVFLNPKP